MPTCPMPISTASIWSRTAAATAAAPWAPRRWPPESDPSLRRGGVITVPNGLVVYRLSRRRRRRRNRQLHAGQILWQVFKKRAKKALHAPGNTARPARHRGDAGDTAGHRRARHGRQPDRSEITGHFLSQRQRAGQPRRLDSEQLHQTRQPVLRRRIDHEIGSRLALAGELGPDAGIVRRQRMVG